MKFQWMVPVENIIGKVPLVPVGDTGTVPYCMGASFPGAYGVADRAPATDAGCGTSTCGLWAGPVTYRPGRPAPAVPGRRARAGQQARRGAGAGVGAARARRSPQAAADQAPRDHLARRARGRGAAAHGGPRTARAPPVREIPGAARRGPRLNELEPSARGGQVAAQPGAERRRPAIELPARGVEGNRSVRGHCCASEEREGIFFCESL